MPIFNPHRFEEEDRLLQRQLLGEQISARVDKRAHDNAAIEAFMRALNEADSGPTRTLQGLRGRPPELIQKEPIGFKMPKKSE